MKWSAWFCVPTSLALASCGGGGGGAPEAVIPPPGNGNFYVTAQYSDAQVTVVKDIVYSHRPNAGGVQYTSDLTIAQEVGTPELTLKLDVWVPPNATATTPQPLIVYIHGGSFLAGSKEERAENAMGYAVTGYVSASVNYRLTPNNEVSPTVRLTAIEQASEDVMNAIRFLKVNAATYHIDPTRIATIGTSAGGGISMINAVQYDTLAGAVSDFPGVSSRVDAAVSTGATLYNNEGYDSDSILHYDATDTNVMLFHARPTDSFTGATWDANVIPTQDRINNSGNICITVAQPDLTHTVSLAVGGPHWGTLQPFLSSRLRL